MGNCFTIVYVLDQVSGTKGETLETFHLLENESDRFLDEVLNVLEIEVPDYLVDQVLQKAGNS
jgi:hypothetical protein